MGTSDRTAAFTTGSPAERYARHLAPYLFEPWARVLLDRVAPAAGAAVLDVAAGTGVVSRQAAERVGTSGRVVASDISPAMIESIAAAPPAAGAAPIETLVAPADALGLPDASFEVAVCQQGLPFFPDRPAAARELRRVLRPGGRAAVAVWAAGHGLLPFQAMHDVLAEAGAAEPYPGAFDESSYVMSAGELEEIFRGAGFGEVAAEEVELVARWPSVQALVDAIAGTPLLPVLDGLGPEGAEAARRRLGDRFAEFAAEDGAAEVPTVAAIAVATA
ncbi:MAG TPA: methyltransferase domain-containing protein [Gaiellaceae bacterium]